MDQNNEVEGVQFETDSYKTDSYKAVKFYDETGTPKIVKVVMKYSGGASEKQAEYAIFGLVILAIAVSLFLFFRGGGNSSSTQYPDMRNIDQKLYYNLK